MESFTTPLFGGALIGLAAAAMLLFKGRIAGISGVFGSIIDGNREPWRLAFVGGLIAGGVVLALVRPSFFAVPHGRSWLAVAGAGLLVGFGTRMGGGCTSGHGVCGISRFSVRSIVATVVFMAFGVITATGLHLLGVAQ